MIYRIDKHKSELCDVCGRIGGDLAKIEYRKRGNYIQICDSCINTCKETINVGWNYKASDESILEYEMNNLTGDIK